MLEGSYEANSRWVLARQVLIPTAPTQLSLVITTEPPAPFKLQLLKAPTGAEVSWTATDYAVALERTSGPSGALTVHNAALPPGKYVACLTLEGGEGMACGEGLQPSPVDGVLSGGGGIKWRAVYMPSTDDKVCPIVQDDSQQRYFKAMFEAWAAAPPPGGAGAAASAPPPAKGGKGAAATAGGAGGPRAQQAAAALEKLEAAMAAEAEAATTPVDAPSRTLKDGSNLVLEPDARVSVKSATKPYVLTSEQLEERAAAAAAAVAGTAETEAAAGVSPVASSLDHGKGGRSALATRRAAEFSEWRTQTSSGAKAALRARAVAMLRIKQAEEAARLAAEAARLEEEEAAAAAAAATAEAAAAAAAATHTPEAVAVS